MSNASLIARLKKLLALAERGVGVEKVNATVALEAAMRKHNLTMFDLCESSRERHVFKWRGETERKLLLQIIVTVCGSEVRVFRAKRGCQYVVPVTQQERVEIEVLWSAHRRQLKNEMALFFSAYLHRHELFPSDGESHDSPLTQEEADRIKRMALMMSGMADVTVRKQLKRNA